jgi:DNA-binding response OmpR family regulator
MSENKTKADILANILVVEDDPAILKGLLDVLVFNNYQAQGADHGDAGLEMALAGEFDLVLLDVMLPGCDGFEICRRVRKARPDQAVIMLTAKGDEEDILTGFAAGADDYVPKPFSIRELLVRVEALLRRSGRVPALEPVRWRGLRFDPGALTMSKEDEGLEITRREMDIVAYLHRHRERIVSKKELLTEVWRYPDADIETRTVDIHILKLRKKIAQLAGPGDFIVTVRGEGLRLAPENQDQEEGAD